MPTSISVRIPETCHALTVVMKVHAPSPGLPHLLPGDFLNVLPPVSGHTPPERITKLLAPFSASGRAFAVRGNHDAELSVARVEAALEGCGSAC